MILEREKTHRLVKQPRISVARLADYMAASEQAKRSIISSCKYRAIARVIQHDEAKTTIADFLTIPKGKLATLKEKLEAMESRFFETPFETEVNEHNCDYLRRFIETYEHLRLPDGQYRATGNFPAIELHGTSVSFIPDRVVARTTRRNTRKIGAIMLRYAKSKNLVPKVAEHQSAFIFGYLKKRPFEENSTPELALCITLDAHCGKPYAAPTNSVYLFKEMEAACASISERWPAIPAPLGAVF